MNHVVLLGDSIFDNARYVPGGPCVEEHLRRHLPAGWRVTLLARDGAVCADVVRQLEGIPDDADHLVVSAGGNDALGHAQLVRTGLAVSFAEVLEALSRIQDDFRADYRRLLAQVARHKKPMVVCTIYDAISGLQRAERAALCLFNDVIMREGCAGGLPIIDLRLVCQQATDYSPQSPIEPSIDGGRKIASAIARVVTDARCQDGRACLCI